MKLENILSAIDSDKIAIDTAIKDTTKDLKKLVAQINKYEIVLEFILIVFIKNKKRRNNYNNNLYFILRLQTCVYDE